MWQCVGVLYYVSSTVNPILYNVMSYRYRRAFCDTLFRCTVCRQSQRPSLTVAALSSSFATASLRDNRPRAALSHSASAAAAITTAKAMAADRTVTVSQGAGDADQLSAVAGGRHRRHRCVSTPDSNNTWSVRHFDGGVETADGEVVDAVDLRTVREHWLDLRTQTRALYWCWELKWCHTDLWDAIRWRLKRSSLDACWSSCERLERKNVEECLWMCGC